MCTVQVRVDVMKQELLLLKSVLNLCCSHTHQSLGKLVVEPFTSVMGVSVRVMGKLHAC